MPPASSGWHEHGEQTHFLACPCSAFPFCFSVSWSPLLSMLCSFLFFCLGSCFSCSFVRSFVRLFVCLFVCSFVCLFAWLLLASVARSLARLLACSAWLFVCLVDHVSPLCSFALPFSSWSALVYFFVFLWSFGLWSHLCAFQACPIGWRPLSCLFSHSFVSLLHFHIVPSVNLSLYLSGFRNSLV